MKGIPAGAGAGSRPLWISSLSMSMFVFLIVWSQYERYVSSWISGGDSGELATCLCLDSVCHPPGYPLFTILYSFGTYLLSIIDATQTSAYYYSLISAILASIASIILAFTAYQLTRSISASTFTSLVFSLSATVLQYSTQVEVFALNNLLMISFIWSLTTSRYLSAAFISGLAMSNQHTSLLFILPLAVLSLLRNTHKFHLGTCLKLIGLFSAGLIPPYSLLYLRSGRYRSWGHTDHIIGIIKHIIRYEYGTFRLANDNMDNSSTIWNRIGLYALDLFDQISIFICIIAMLGIWHSRHSRFARDLLLTWIFYIFTFALLNNMNAVDPLLQGVQQRFYQQPLIIISLMSAFGYQYLEQKLGATCTSSLAASILSMHIWRSMPSHTTSIVQYYAEQALQSIPAGSLVFVSGDLLVHPMLYLQSCEHDRLDLDIIPVPNLASTWFISQQARYFRNVTFPGQFLYSQPPGFTAVQLIQANIGTRRIYSCGGGLLAAGENPAVLRQSFQVQTVGICSEIMTSKPNPDWNQLKMAFDSLMKFEDDHYPLRSWDHAVLQHAQLRKRYLFHAMYEFIFDKFQNQQLNFSHLLLATQLYETVEESLKDIQMYRRAADLFGWLSRMKPDPYEQYMFQSLSKIVEIEKDDAIELLIRRRQNPYLIS